MQIRIFLHYLLLLFLLIFINSESCFAQDFEGKMKWVEIPKTIDYKIQKGNIGVPKNSIRFCGLGENGLYVIFENFDNSLPQVKTWVVQKLNEEGQVLKTFELSDIPKVKLKPVGYDTDLLFAGEFNGNFLVSYCKGVNDMVQVYGIIYSPSFELLEGPVLLQEFKVNSYTEGDWTRLTQVSISENKRFVGIQSHTWQSTKNDPVNIHVTLIDEKLTSKQTYDYVTPEPKRYYKFYNFHVTNSGTGVLGIRNASIWNKDNSLLYISILKFRENEVEEFDVPSTKYQYEGVIFTSDEEDNVYGIAEYTFGIASKKEKAYDRNKTIGFHWIKLAKNGNISDFLVTPPSNIMEEYVSKFEKSEFSKNKKAGLGPYLWLFSSEKLEYKNDKLFLFGSESRDMGDYYVSTNISVFNFDLSGELLWAHKIPNPGSVGAVNIAEFENRYIVSYIGLEENFGISPKENTKVASAVTKSHICQFEVDEEGVRPFKIFPRVKNLPYLFSDQYPNEWSQRQTFSDKIYFISTQEIDNELYYFGVQNLE